MRLSGHLADERVPWPDYFLGLAKAVAARSTCPRLSVGAVLTYQNRVLSCGYNGSPAGTPHCTEVGCLVVPCEHPGNPHQDHCVRTIHAERNAVSTFLKVAREISPQKLHGALHLLKQSVLYLTHSPCPDCLEYLAHYRVTQVVYWDPYQLGQEVMVIRPLKEQMNVPSQADRGHLRSRELAAPR